MSNAEAPSTPLFPPTIKTNPDERGVFASDPFSATTHLTWALRAWATLVTLCITLHGVSLGLRGAFVGRGNLVVQFSTLSDVLTQCTAFVTGVALVYLGLSTIRATRNPYLGILAALLGAGPTAVSFLAQKYALNHDLGFASALLCGFTMVLCAHQSRKNNDVRLVVAVAGGSLLCAAARIALERSGQIHSLSVALGGLETSLRWATLALLVVRLRSKCRAPAVAVTTLLGVSLLLAQAAVTASSPDARGVMLVVGRSIAELSPHPTLGLGGPFGFSVALCATSYSLLFYRSSLAQLCLSLVALGVFSPTTPLVCAWLTAVVFALVLICWVAPTESADNSAPAGFG